MKQRHLASVLQRGNDNGHNSNNSTVSSSSNWPGVAVAVIACLACFFIQTSAKHLTAQTPEVTIGQFQSLGGTECVVDGRKVLSLQAVVKLKGATEASWLNGGVHFLAGQEQICVASVAECLSTQTSGCHCHSYEAATQTYVIVLKQWARRRYSGRPVVARISSTGDPADLSVTSEEVLYPVVSGSINDKLHYGSKTKNSGLSGSVLDIATGTQSVQFVVKGLSPPYVVSYNTNDQPDVVQQRNAESVSIPVSDVTEVITLMYQEDGHCQRSQGYEMNVLWVEEQSPRLTIGQFQASSCLLDDQGQVSLEATVDLTGQDTRDWFQTAYFLSSAGQICHVRLTDCPPETRPYPDCHCHGREADVFTLRLNQSATPSLSGKPVHMELFSADYTVVLESVPANYPLFDEPLDISMTYGSGDTSVQYSPPRSNTTLGRPGEDQAVTFSVRGLREPFTLKYLKPATPAKLLLVQNEVTIRAPLEADTKHFRLSYEERGGCMRSGVYFFNVEEEEIVTPESAAHYSPEEIAGIAVGGGAGLIVLIVSLCAYCLVPCCRVERKKCEPKNIQSQSPNGDYNENITYRAHDTSGYSSITDVPPDNPNEYISATTPPANMNKSDASDQPMQTSTPRKDVGEAGTFGEEQGPFISVIKTSTTLY